MSQLYGLLQALNKCEVAGLPVDSGLSCNQIQADLLCQLENTFHQSADSMEFMRQSTQVFKTCEKDQSELISTVNQFVRGYCDALEQTSILGNKSVGASDCIEVVDITSDDSYERQDMDESDVGKELLSYIEGKGDIDEGSLKQAKDDAELRKWLFGHMTQPLQVESEKNKTSHQPLPSESLPNPWFSDTRRRKQATAK